MTRQRRKALVLSGGGSAGAAWMLGFIRALDTHGVDLGEADLVVGTSAGARAGAQLATGALEQAVEMVRRPAVPQSAVPAGLAEFVAASTRIAAEVADEQEAARRIANLEPLGPGIASEVERKRAIAAQLPVQVWPESRLVITAVESASGRRVTFDASSGVPLLDAVTASGALPGIYPLATIHGRHYADGGVHSPYNADLAAGYDLVIVLTPLPFNDHRRRKLDAELAALSPASVHLVLADDASLAAMGANPLSAATGGAALEAGGVQAEREIDAVRSAWQPGAERQARPG